MRSGCIHPLQCQLCHLVEAQRRAWLTTVFFFHSRFLLFLIERWRRANEARVKNSEQTGVQHSTLLLIKRVQTAVTNSGWQGSMFLWSADQKPPRSVEKKKKAYYHLQSFNNLHWICWTFMLREGLPRAIPESQSLLSMDERVQLYLAHLWMIHVWLSIINCGEITIPGLRPLISAGIRCRHYHVYAVY